MKIFWFIVGSLALALGTIGVFLPVLPTVPFYLLAVFAYRRSSERLRQRISQSTFYQTHVDALFRRREMRHKDRLTSMLSVTLLFAVLVFMARQRLWLCGILVGLWLAHMVFFIMWVKSVETSERLLLVVSNDGNDERLWIDHEKTKPRTDGRFGFFAVSVSACHLGSTVPVYLVLYVSQ